MASGSVPRQDRSRRRREALLRAAVEILTEEGARSVTHRAVAERSGLPLASTTYYFESVDQLLDEALKLHAAERVTELEVLMGAVWVSGASAHDVATGLAGLFDTRATGLLVAQYQMYIDAARNPQLQPAVSEALAAFERLAAAVLTALGAADPEASAGSFVALLDGFALHRVARPRPTEEEAGALFRALRALFLEQVMSPPERDRLYRRLRRPLEGPLPAPTANLTDRPVAAPP